MTIALSRRESSFQAVSRGRLSRSVAAAMLTCATAWSAAVLFLWLAQPWLLFRSFDDGETTDFDRHVFVESSFMTADGLRLEGVRLTHATDGERYWILFCLPAGASIREARTQGHLEQLWRLDYNVFAFDYRGMGGNGGTPSEGGFYEDAIAAYRSLISADHVAPARVILAGRSLGTSVAVDLATRVESGGLLLFSPIDSVPAAAARLYPWAPVALLARYRFDNSLKAPAVRAPVMVVYGAPDPYLPLGKARSLFETFPRHVKMLETQGNHHHSGFKDMSEVRQLNAALHDIWPVAAVRRAASPDVAALEVKVDAPNR